MAFRRSLPRYRGAYRVEAAALADVDELLDAVRSGLLTPEVAEQAVRRAVAAIDGLARDGYDCSVG